MNRSRAERNRQPSKPEFGWGFVAVGIFTGIVGGIIWKLTRGGHSYFTMFAGALAGSLGGAAISAGRYARDRHRFRLARPTNSRS